MDEMERMRIDKTIVHLTDDKGWERVEEAAIDYLGRSYRVHKKKSLCANRYDKCNTYEFEWVKTEYEKVDDYFIKHMYFEMRK